MGWGKIPSPEGMAERVRQAFGEMLGWAESGRVRPLTHGRFALGEFRQALALISSREVIGKLVLHPHC